MKIVLAGASGLVGSALQRHWRVAGHDVVRLVRRATVGADEVAWDPVRGVLDAGALIGCNVLVNLAGAGIAEGRWTVTRKRLLRDSRVTTTALLARAIEGGGWRPKLWVNASAIGYYGDAGEQELDETSPAGSGFLADLCREWEMGTEPARKAGVRVVRLRLGVVLDPAGGVLAKLLPVFRAGLGGPLGDGRRWMSWITLGELCRVLDTVVGDDGPAGAVNAVSPHAVRNAVFSSELGRVLGRPAWVRTPDWAVRAVLGEMGRELVLTSQLVRPRALEAHGFVFAAGGLGPALADMPGLGVGRARVRSG